MTIIKEKFQYLYPLNLVMDVGMETIRVTEANYPEGVRRVFLINGNYISNRWIWTTFTIHENDTI